MRFQRVHEIILWNKFLLISKVIKGLICNPNVHYFFAQFGCKSYRLQKLGRCSMANFWVYNTPSFLIAKTVNLLKNIYVCAHFGRKLDKYTPDIFCFPWWRKDLNILHLPVNTSLGNRVNYSLGKILS